MTEIDNDKLEFEILGHKVNFKPDNVDSSISPSEIVEYIKSEALEMRKKTNKLSAGEVAVLVALKMAHEKLSIEQEYRDNITKLQNEVYDAKKVIDSLSI